VATLVVTEDPAYLPSYHLFGDVSDWLQMVLLWFEREVKCVGGVGVVYGMSLVYYIEMCLAHCPRFT
jgi:hypothetical protein